MDELCVRCNLKKTVYIMNNKGLRLCEQCFQLSLHFEVDNIEEHDQNSINHNNGTSYKNEC